MQEEQIERKMVDRTQIWEVIGGDESKKMCVKNLKTSSIQVS